MHPSPIFVLAPDRRERLDHGVVADLHVGVDHRGARGRRCSPLRACAARGSPAARAPALRQRHPVVDAEHQAHILEHDATATGSPPALRRSSTCGRYSSPWALSALRRAQRLPQRHPPGRHRCPCSPRRISRSSGVASPSLLGLHDPLDRSARIAHHPPIAARIVEHRAHHRGGCAALRGAPRSAPRSPRRSRAAHPR